MKRTLIAELEMWTRQQWVVVVEGSGYYERDEEHHFTSQEAALIYMDKKARAGHSTKLYLEEEED